MPHHLIGRKYRMGQKIGSGSFGGAFFKRVFFIFDNPQKAAFELFLFLWLSRLASTMP